MQTREIAELRAGWPQNGLRHSFASYHFAKYRNENETAAHMGSSPGMLFKHYRELVRPADATAYFEIMPPPDAVERAAAVCARRFRPIPRALVCVTGTIQQPVLKKLLTGDGAQHFDNGLAARFLMALPPEQERKWREAVTPPEIVRRYVELFKDLFALVPQIDAKTENRTSQLVHLSPAAKSLFVDFVNRHGRELRAFKDDRLKSAWSKLEAQAARLALVFHVVREAYLPSPSEDAARNIAPDTMQAALEWVEWFKNETRRIYCTLTHAGNAGQADKLIRFARRNGGRCTARDAACVGAGGRTARDVENLMVSLVAAGFGEWEEPGQPKGGRPTRYFRLNSPSQNRETDKTPSSN